MLRLIYISRLDAALNRSGLQGVYSYTPAAPVQAARASIENTLSQHILIKVSLHIKPSHYLQFAVESFFFFLLTGFTTEEEEDGSSGIRRSRR